jgi:hypothetical protein
MGKSIERAYNKRQGRVQVGIKSETFNGFASTDQMLAWKDKIEEESYEDIKVPYHQVRFEHDRKNRQEQDKLHEKLSGDVVKRHISELSEEERKRYNL